MDLWKIALLYIFLECDRISWVKTLEAPEEFTPAHF